MNYSMDWDSRGEADRDEPTELDLVYEELHKARTALELIAAFKGRTLLNMDLDADGNRAYQLGANAAFEQAADIAIDALATSSLLGRNSQ